MRFLLIIFPLLNSFIILGQSCCSGGVGNPLAGDQSIGVLEKFHMEVSTSFQYNHSDFYFSSENRLDTISDKLSSTYLFLKSDYGLSNKFTLSIASGYFFDKTLEKDDGDKMKSSGLGDIIIFPRYEIYNKMDAGGRIEATLGMGVKIPMGAYKDSTFLMSNELVGDIYTINPAILQLSSGSQDLMIYTSILRNFVKAKCRVFATGLYIKKGYNSLGQKFGDYASIALFFGKNTFNNISFSAQIKGELVGKLKLEEGVLSQNVMPESTGSKKIFFIPQISYSHKQFSYYLRSEAPLYQYLSGTQLGSSYQVTVGISYRLIMKKAKVGLFNILD